MIANIYKSTFHHKKIVVFIDKFKIYVKCIKLKLE